MQEQGALNWGDTAAQAVARRIYGAVDAEVDLANAAIDRRIDGMLAVVNADNSLWVFDADSTAPAVPGRVVVPTLGDGRWIRASVTTAELSAASKAGTSTLVAGTVTINTVAITANSRILVTMKDPGAGAITGFATFSVPNGSRTVGAPGSFVINAIDDAKAVINTAICTVDWLVIG